MSIEDRLDRIEASLAALHARLGSAAPTTAPAVDTVPATAPVPLTIPRYFTADSFADGPRAFTIKSIRKENVSAADMPTSYRLVLRFEETDCVCILNAERVAALTALFGERMDSAIGKRVQLYRGFSRIRGRTVPVLAIGPSVD